MRGKSPTCREASQTLSGLRPEVYGSLDKNRFPGARAIGGSETRKAPAVLRQVGDLPPIRRLSRRWEQSLPTPTLFQRRHGDMEVTLDCRGIMKRRMPMRIPVAR